MKKSKVFLNKKVMLTWLIIICFMIVFSRANIYQVISPFSGAFAFALVACGFNMFAVAFCFAASFLVFNFSFNNIICCAFVSSVLIIFGIIKLTNKKPLAIYITLIAVAFSRLANIYFNFYVVSIAICSVFDLFIGIAFCFCLIKVMSSALSKGMQSFTSREKIMIYIILLAVSLGLNNLNFYGIDITKFIFILTLLLLSRSGTNITINVSCIMTISSILYSVQSVNIGVYFILSCVCVWFSKKNKFLQASMLCLTDSLLGLLSSYTIINLLPCLLATLVFVSIPQKIIKFIAGYFVGFKKSIITNYYATKKQEIIKSKLYSMAVLFEEMQKSYRSLITSSVNTENAIELLASEVKLNVCESCINKINCYNGKDMTCCIKELVELSIKKGKVNFLDVPNLLSSNCNKINVCLSAINNLAIDYIATEKKNKSADDGKLNIALQLGGTSKIFKELSSQFNANDILNASKSCQIKNAIENMGMVCTECQVFENSLGVSEIIVVVRNIDTVNINLAKALESVYPIKFERKMCFQTKIAGWSIVCFVPLNRFELVCGFASTPKSIGDQNGDNYVYTKLTDSKYLVALCDGMGHGKQANNISTIAMNLIESFYKSGLGSGIILDSVNNILLPAGGGTFSTLDASIVDLCTGEVDFIKIGSTISVVKLLGECKIVNVESLPLGVVAGVVPSTSKYVLRTGDIVVIVSDGIVDVFASQEEFCNFVNNETSINMQLFAENILEEATSRVMDKKDDMTVIAYRIINKR